MKICLAGTGAMGVIHMKALQKIDGVEVVSIASRTDESAKAFAEEMEDSVLLDQSRGVHRSPRRRRGHPDDPERPARGPDAARAVEREARPGRDSDGAEPAGLRAHARGVEEGGEDADGHAHPPLLEPASRDQAPDSRGDVPPASHGGRDVFLPPHEPEHARPAAVVGGQPAVASRLPFGRHRAVDSGRPELGRVGTEGPGSRRSSASRWTSPWP